MLNQVFALMDMAGRAPRADLLKQLFERYRASELKAVDGDVAPYSMASVRFPYAFGGGYVAQAWIDHGREGIDRLFDYPPSNTSEILFSRPRSGFSKPELTDECVPTMQASSSRAWGSSAPGWLTFTLAVWVRQCRTRGIWQV